jgi:hypothetical protein
VTTHSRTTFISEGTAPWKVLYMILQTLQVHVQTSVNLLIYIISLGSIIVIEVLFWSCWRTNKGRKVIWCSGFLTFSYGRAMKVMFFVFIFYVTIMNINIRKISILYSVTILFVSRPHNTIYHNHHLLPQTN